MGKGAKSKALLGQLPRQSITRVDRWIGLGIGLVSFLIYAYTAAPGLTVEDSGDFITGIATGGVIHPSGYPLYCLLVRLFCLLPVWSIPFKVNLFSGLCGAATTSLTYFIFRTMGGERIASVFAAGALALSGIFWEYCVVAETYTLNTLLIAGTILFVLKYNAHRNLNALLGAALCMGLGLSNHYPLFTPCVFVFVGMLSDKKALVRNYQKLILLFLVGLTPYTYLFIQALRDDVPYKFLHISSVGDVVRHILRKHYPHGDGGDVFDSVLLTFRTLKELLWNFSLASVFLLAGWVVAYWKKWNYRLVLTVGLFMTSAALIFVTYFKNTDANYAFVRKYMLPFYLLSSCFVCYGVSYFWQFGKMRRLLACVLPCILILEGMQNFSTSNHRDDTLMRDWALATLNHLAPNSVLILCGPDAFAINYFHKVEGIRPDVTLYDHLGIFTDNIYGVPIWKLPNGGNIRKAKLNEFVKTSTRPVYFDCTSVLEEFNLTYQVSAFAYRLQNNLSGSFQDAPEVHLSESFLNGLFHSFPKTEFWQDRRRVSISTRLFNYFALVSPDAFNAFFGEFKKSKFFADPAAIIPIAQNMRLLKRELIAREILDQERVLSGL